MNVAIVGVTGLVGQTFLKVLEERNFPVSKIIPVASHKNKGKKITFNKQQYPIITIEELLNENFDIALWSAGATISKQWMPKFIELSNAYHIDNSSAWRMHPNIPLIVPEVNINTINKNHKLIANPNCSTIQLVVVLAPLHRRFKIKRVIVSTYQAVSGSGKKAVNQLMAERENKEPNERAYNHQIDLNCIPQCDVFVGDGYTKEEMKIINETRKILNHQELKITATAVRVPVLVGHSETVNIEFEEEPNIKDVITVLKSAPGIVVYENNEYPTPIDVAGKDEVFVGRIRKDSSNKNSINLWIVADNLRKGAATNAIQIAEYIKHFVTEKYTL